MLLDSKTIEEKLESLQKAHPHNVFYSEAIEDVRTVVLDIKTQAIKKSIEDAQLAIEKCVKLLRATISGTDGVK